MAAPHLTAVPTPAEAGLATGEVVDLGRGVETGGQRIARLQAEARALAREQVEAFARDLTALAQRAAEIAEGGEVYPVGARELAPASRRRLPAEGPANGRDHGSRDAGLGRLSAGPPPLNQSSDRTLVGGDGQRVTV